MKERGFDNFLQSPSKHVEVSQKTEPHTHTNTSRSEESFSEGFLSIPSPSVRKTECLFAVKCQTGSQQDEEKKEFPILKSRFWWSCYTIPAQPFIFTPHKGGRRSRLRGILTNETLLGFMA